MFPNCNLLLPSRKVTAIHPDGRTHEAKDFSQEIKFIFNLTELVD